MNSYDTRNFGTCYSYTAFSQVLKCAYLTTGAQMSFQRDEGGLLFCLLEMGKIGHIYLENWMQVRKQR